MLNKILIVDDDPVNLEFFQFMLSKLGFTVKEATDGIDALEKLKEFSPDVIILDIIMPRMSGLELIKILKEDEKYRDIPVILFSALDDVKDKAAGFELGADDYITKPFNFSEMLARIKNVLRFHAFRLMLVKLERDIDDLDNAFKSLNMSDVPALLIEMLSKKVDKIRETIVIGKREYDEKCIYLAHKYTEEKKNLRRHRDSGLHGKSHEVDRVGSDMASDDKSKGNVPTSDIMKYCIVRTYSAGVFAGYIEHRKEHEVVLREARRIWYWEGAATLSQLAQSGTSLPEKCKFPEPVDRIMVFGAVEILDCTEKAKRSIESVPIYRA